jgi:spore coat polysaccharide biosynthesis predicted glycosyltransferase SpsG
LIKNNGNKIKVHPFVLNDNEAIEINSYQDWWVCEKLLKRKRIIFNVIGSDKIGMGHIYRSLTLAHEITDHEIIFVCDEQSRIAVDKIAGYDYMIKAFNPHVMEEQILSLKPDLVINDTLDTTKKYIMRLKENNIKVVNFEDLGPGARYTDVTINEVFDEPKFNSKNTKWGNKYFFLRDEFNDAKSHKLAKKVENLLITFGGTDQNNYTQKTLTTIVNFCKKENIKIYIVNGDGYLYKEQLSRYLKELGYKNLEFTFATGVISKIMEKTQIAVTSNGRTTYELAHMNIPSIVISHHERENTHRFAVEERGFINLGCYKKGATENLLLRALKKLVYDNNYRKRLFDNIKIYNFSKNKKKVVKLVLNLLEAE